MAKGRKAPAVETTDQDAELRAAQSDVADYGRDGEVDSLVKAIQGATDELSKAKAADGSPVGNDDEDDADEDDQGEGDEDEQADDGDEDDEGEEEPEDEDASDAAPAPPRRGAPAPGAGRGAPAPAPGRGAPMRRSRADADESERFLKSVLLDDDGAPTAEAEVIEVSDVLTHLTDTFAKSIGELAGALREEIGMLQLQLDELSPLVKAMGHHQVQTGKIVKSIDRGMNRLAKSGGSRTPNPGMTYSMKKSMPGAVQNGDGGTLTKSQAAAGLLAAFQTQAISGEQYRRLAPALDTQGVEAVLAQLPEGVAGQIKAAALALNGSTNGKH